TPTSRKPTATAPVTANATAGARRKPPRARSTAYQSARSRCMMIISSAQRAPPRGSTPHPPGARHQRERHHVGIPGGGGLPLVPALRVLAGRALVGRDRPGGDRDVLE